MSVLISETVLVVVRGAVRGAESVDAEVEFGARERRAGLALFGAEIGGGDSALAGEDQRELARNVALNALVGALPSG